MAKIPKFKTLAEEREFWATHSFADYAEDTEELRVSDDSNVTRRRRWSCQVYLSPEEGVALDELARKLGQAKSNVIRLAVKRLMTENEINPASIASGYLAGINIASLGTRIAYLAVQLRTESPDRDADLGKKLKSIISIALPGCGRIDVVLRKVGVAARIGALTDSLGTIDIKGDLTDRERSRVERAMEAIVARAVAGHLAARHGVRARAG